jgi:Dyp-type peroxidase family
MPKFHTADSTDPDSAKLLNNFTYTDNVCPISSHIRKTNIREKLTGNDGDPRALRTTIIRNGIPYGPDYTGDANDKSKRGLLFACYQGHIEDGFQNMQANWSNNPEFRTGNPGHDPIIGQVPQKKENNKWVNGDLKTFFFAEKTNTREELNFQQLVTLKGGGYFFVPSISALSNELASA